LNTQDKPRITVRSNQFSFGDPETVLTGQIGDYLGIFTHNGDYYTPPISLTGLVKCTRANAHHGSALFFKMNMATRYLKPNTAISLAEFRKSAYDWGWCGQMYFRQRKNVLGGFLRLEHLPALYMRKMSPKHGSNRFCMLLEGAKRMDFEQDEVIHIKEYDPIQQIYGLPQYLGGLQSMLLNEDATLFRRKYYSNGAHMGYIFLNTSAELSEDDEITLKDQITKSKGVGNFRSMFLSLPGAENESIKIIPVGDISTKDEFQRVKDITRNDVLAMHRIYPALAAVMPDNEAGFGDIEKISKVNYHNEVVPAQQVFLQLNDYLPGNKQIAFDVPEFLTDEKPDNSKSKKG